MNPYLSSAVRLEGVQHGRCLQEETPHVDGEEVLVSLLQSHVEGVPQLVCQGAAVLEELLGVEEDGGQLIRSEQTRH